MGETSTGMLWIVMNVEDGGNADFAVQRMSRL